MRTDQLACDTGEGRRIAAQTVRGGGFFHRPFCVPYATFGGSVAPC